MSNRKAMKAALKRIKTAKTKSNFPALFNEACAAMGLDDGTAACVFDTSQPAIKAWREGTRTPLVWSMVLDFAKAELERRIEALDVK